MKPGSHVVCIDNSRFEAYIKKDFPYTAREITPVGHVLNSNNPTQKFKCLEIGIRLEEVVSNPTVNGLIWDDMPFPLQRFRELQLPGELAEVLTKELQLV